MILPSIHSIALSIWDPVQWNREHSSKYCHFIHIASGQSVLHIGKMQFSGKKGDTFIIPAGCIHRDELKNESTFKPLLVLFCWKDFPKYFTASSNKDLLKISVAAKDKIREACFEMYRVMRENPPFARQMVRASFYQLLMSCKSAMLMGHASQAGQKATNKTAIHGSVIPQVKNYIAGHFSEPLSLAAIAESIRKSPYYLSHIFSQETGFTLSGYITQCRMKAAAKMLANQTANISEIAYSVGYDDPNYFCKAFRKFHGKPPGGFRGLLLAGDSKKLP